jgi:hypothetical protein
MTDRPRWWLIGVAVLVAGIFLYESIGMVGAGLLVAGFGLGTMGWRLYRKRVPAKGPSVRCLSCGETLASTARECKYCGSARWTVN